MVHTAEELRCRFVAALDRDVISDAVAAKFASISYEGNRYLEKVFRRELDLVGTPVRIEFRTSENPYAEKRNKLTQRQVQRKRRLMAHVKKSKKKKK